MLKEVMMGSGGILLAAAVVASSVSPGTPRAPDTAPPVPAQQIVAAPPTQQAAPSPPQPVFADDSGDMQFGAPMIEAAPVEDSFGEAVASTADPDSAEAAGGRQFYAQPGRPNPIPR